jgi:hypothetical protein
MFDTVRALSSTCLLAIALVALGGCAFLRGSATGSAFVEAGERHLQLPDAQMADMPGVAWLAPDTYEEYQRTQNNGRAEALYMRARAPGTALDLAADRLDSLTRRWAFNRQGTALNWQQPRAVRLPGSRIRYRHYRYSGHSATGDGATRACVAFLRRWEMQSDDPQFRPARAYFGYYCRPPGAALSEAETQAYLRRIEVADLDLPGFYLGQTVEHDVGAGEHANAAPGDAWGLAPFPFQRTRHYPIGGISNAGE